MKDRIEKILRLEQISSSKFADEIGVQRSSISHLFTGRNKPSLELVQKILNRFSNLNSEWLLSGKGDMYKKSVQTSLFNNAIKTDDIKTSEILPEFQEKDIETQSMTDKVNDFLNPVQPESKIIEKIIVFYSNNSFIEYFPAKE
jgi:transcriptional regulator with XRE-family HTH domain